MPAWKDTLTGEEIRNVVAYIKTFSKKFGRARKKGRIPEPVTIGAPPKWTAEDREEGKRLFKKNCEKCHGGQGRGSGPSAVSLQDDWGDRIWPRDLTKGWTYRGGNSPEDIFRTVATGITGTPMPSHLESLGEENVWKIVGFVDSIVERKRPRVGAVIVSRYSGGELPADPGDARWDECEKSRFPLAGQIIAGERWFKPTLDGVYACSIYNDDEITLYVEWADRSQSPLQKAPDKYPENEPDALAVQFPQAVPTGMEKPYFLGGSAKAPVLIWKWTNGPADVADVFLGRGILNVEKLPDGRQAVKARAVYKDGLWKVVFRRAIIPPGGVGPEFETGRYIPIAFNAWDGSNGEKDEKRAVSIWYRLYLEPPTGMGVYLLPLIVGLLAAVGEAVLVKIAAKNGREEVE